MFFKQRRACVGLVQSKNGIDMRISGTRFLNLDHKESFYPKQRIGMLGLVSFWDCASVLKAACLLASGPS